MKKRYILCIATSIMMCIVSFVFFNMTKTEEKHIKVGFIFSGDAITPYTENFINARDSLEAEYGDNIECVTKYNVADEQIDEFLDELVDEKCDYIIAASYGYQAAVKEKAEQNPDIDFCVPLGDNANDDEVLSNYHTCAGTIYQGRYVCGVVAGEKLKEMIDSDIITKEEARIGFVASFPYSQAISGYTAFFLGVQSVVPEATMLVKYTNTWSDYYAEKEAATELIDKGCVIISQHTDTVGPAVACENATKNIPVYHVGYNQSMTDVAPTRSLVSCSTDYSYYFKQSVGALIEGKKIETCIDGKVIGQDAMAGLKEGWVRVLDINNAILPADIENVVDETVEKLENGKIEVFSGKFTGVNPNDNSDTIDLSTPYMENADSSAPSFKYILDDVIKIVE